MTEDDLWLILSQTLSVDHSCFEGFFGCDFEYDKAVGEKVKLSVIRPDADVSLKHDVWGRLVFHFPADFDWELFQSEVRLLRKLRVLIKVNKMWSSGVFPLKLFSSLLCFKSV
jgi:hypothetical protein